MNKVEEVFSLIWRRYFTYQLLNFTKRVCLRVEAIKMDMPIVKQFLVFSLSRAYL